MMKNKNNGLPIGFEGQLVEQKFPADKPIFWGPNQKTTYPDEYNEPSDWNKFDLMKIPPVIRFITGGNFIPTPHINRRIYLGFTDIFNVRVFYVSDPPDPRGIALGTFNLWKPFHTVSDIAVDYAANLSTTQLLDLVAYSIEIMRPNSDVGINHNYLGGPVSGTYNYDGFVIRTGKKYLTNIGTVASPSGDNPNGDDSFAFESMDSEGLVIGDGGWQGNITGHILNANKLWTNELSSTLYWFLYNTINGDLPSQTNTLVAVAFNSGQFPGSPFWNDILNEAEFLFTLFVSTQKQSITGLILHP